MCTRKKSALCKTTAARDIPFRTRSIATHRSNTSSSLPRSAVNGENVALKPQERVHKRLVKNNLSYLYFVLTLCNVCAGGRGGGAGARAPQRRVSPDEGLGGRVRPWGLGDPYWDGAGGAW